MCDPSHDVMVVPAWSWSRDQHTLGGPIKQQPFTWERCSNARDALNKCYIYISVIYVFQFHVFGEGGDSARGISDGLTCVR